MVVYIDADNVANTEATCAWLSAVLSGRTSAPRVFVVGNQNGAWKPAWERAFLTIAPDAIVSCEVVSAKPEAADAWICSQIARADDRESEILLLSSDRKLAEMARRMGDMRGVRVYAPLASLPAHPGTAKTTESAHAVQTERVVTLPPRFKDEPEKRKEALLQAAMTWLKKHPKSSSIPSNAWDAIAKKTC